MFGRLSKIERAYRRYPSAPLFARFAETCLSQGDIERALAVCLEGCERFPDYPTGFYLLGRCYQARGDLEEARAALDTSLRLDAENPRGFELLAQIYAALGIPTLALKCMEEAARLDPFDETIRLQVEQLSAQEPAVPGATEPIEVGTATASRDEASGESFEAAYTIDEVPAPSEEKETENEEQVPDHDGVGPGIDADIATRAEVAAGDDDDGHGVSDDGHEAERSELQYSESEVEATQVPEVAETQLDPEPEPESTEPASADEPFGVLQDLPEWETEVPQPQPAEAVVDPVPPTTPEPDASDEVAALGAELFGDELPAAPEEPAKPSLPEPTVTPTGNADSVSSDTVEDVEAGSREASRDKSGNSGASKLQRPIPPRVEPEPEPEPEPATAEAATPSNFADEATVDDDHAVAQFSRRGDSEMTDLLRQIDGDGEDERHAESDLPGPIPTTTLAELYSVQGFVDRAIETYRQVLTAQPDNEEAKTRLTALERKD